MYWAIDRYLLEPLLIRPTEWTLEKLTSVYAWLLRWSLRNWGVVLHQRALMVLAAAFVYFDILGRELVPSEDQSRFLVHIICPVGSSIEQVDVLLQEVEAELTRREEIASLLTTVATERGQLMNEADIFVRMVPQDERKKRQQQLMQDVRKELETIRDIRVVIRDQSTEGFTAQRGDPVDFAIQGEWKSLPLYASRIIDEMIKSGKVQDIDSTYRPGMRSADLSQPREAGGRRRAGRAVGR